MNRDTIVVLTSDWHSGSSRALFPDRQWTFKDGVNHSQNSIQKLMWPHFLACADYTKSIRQGKRLIVIHNGDAIDGNHHNSFELLTRNDTEQAEIHVALMNQFLKTVEYDKSKGDKLYYVSGTETHTGTMENNIAQELNAEAQDTVQTMYDHMQLTVNDRKLWFVHHGPGAGTGATEGNNVRNFAQKVYWSCLNKNVPMPDMIVTSHTHKTNYNTYVQNYHTIHAVVTPSFQSKTRYAKKVVPVDGNEVGMCFADITENGFISVLPPMVLDTDSMARVSV